VENRLLRERRDRALLTQEELAGRVGAHPNTVKKWEAGQRPQPEYVRRLCATLSASPSELGFLLNAVGEPYSQEVSVPRALEALNLDPGDLPDLHDIEAATLRLRRSYSTTPPIELEQRATERLRQIRRLLAGPSKPSWRSSLMESAAWLALVRATVLADLREYETAETSILAARELAQEIRHGEIEAWSWETSAWVASAGKRYAEARELSTKAAEVAPAGGYGLVAALGQRARMNGLLRDVEAAQRDLALVEQAMAKAGEPEFPDDHYSIDQPKSRYFGSGAMAAAGRPREAIAYAQEVVAANEDPQTRNWWPVRVADTRMEWALALVDLGEEDEALAMARRAADPEWWRPDTAWRARLVISRMRDPVLRAELSALVEELSRTAL
jgi:transcriptional regulator with XRE-family HTH domain